MNRRTLIAQIVPRMNVLPHNVCGKILTNFLNSAGTPCKEMIDGFMPVPKNLTTSGNFNTWFTISS